jgi:glycosyltransferase involved in cell wall biosynthesis
VIQLPNPCLPAAWRTKLESQLAKRLLPELEFCGAANRAVARAADRLLAQRKFDCLMTTYPPMGSLRVTDQLARKHRLHWIADLRDIPDEFDWQRQRWITRRSVRVLERACASAAHLLTVSEPLGDRLRSAYAIKAPVTIVQNGFEEELMAGLDSVNADTVFRITYCGNLGYGRNPQLLFEALDLLLSRQVDLSGVEVHYYGQSPSSAFCPKPGRSAGLLHCHGLVPHREALSAQLRSAILLSLATPSARGILTSKVFECAMLGRPILSIPPDGDVLDQFVRESGAGHVGNTAEDVAQFLLVHLAAWRKTGLLPQTSPNQSYLRQFSRRAQAKKVGDVLRQVLKCP